MSSDPKRRGQRPAKRQFKANRYTKARKVDLLDVSQAGTLTPMLEVFFFFFLDVDRVQMSVKCPAVEAAELTGHWKCTGGAIF